jgi:hypothetical protein
MNASLSNKELAGLLKKDLKLFGQEPFSSNSMLSGDTFYIDAFARLGISHRSLLKEDPFVYAFVNAMNQAIWHKPIRASSWRLGTSELKRGNSIAVEQERKAVLKRYKQVISDRLYSKYL